MLSDYRTDPKAGVLVSEVILEGTTVGSGELSTIKSQIEGACFDEQGDLIEEVIHAALSDLGFAQASVEKRYSQGRRRPRRTQAGHCEG